MYEAARRLLRSTGGILHVPDSCLDSARILILEISDEIPSMVMEPKVNPLGPEGDIFYECDGRIEFYFGVVAPEIETCWVKPSDRIEDMWEGFSGVAIHLARAGYPGCLGCGGPGSEEIWDEKSSRMST
tara:strand:+ start:1752 stop:2138 length:387 start_codon:yes stop_codon:yes gene_type:complete